LTHPLHVWELLVTTVVYSPEHWHDCRLAAEELESGQGQHRLTRSSGPNVPAAHSVQAAAEIMPDPVCAVPLAQETHADSAVALVPAWYLPGEHCTHADDAWSGW
jgi:hypothetical protein